MCKSEIIIDERKKYYRVEGKSKCCNWQGKMKVEKYTIGWFKCTAYSRWIREKKMTQLRSNNILYMKNNRRRNFTWVAVWMKRRENSEGGKKMSWNKIWGVKVTFIYPWYLGGKYIYF